MTRMGIIMVPAPPVVAVVLAVAVSCKPNSRHEEEEEVSDGCSSLVVSSVSPVSWGGVLDGVDVVVVVAAMVVLANMRLVPIVRRSGDAKTATLRGVHPLPRLPRELETRLKLVLVPPGSTEGRP